MAIDVDIFAEFAGMWALVVFPVLLLLLPAQARLCDCEEVELVGGAGDGAGRGSYIRLEGVMYGGQPAYRHKDQQLFLYHRHQLQNCPNCIMHIFVKSINVEGWSGSAGNGSWDVSATLGGAGPVLLAGQGDCPDRALDWPAGLWTACRAGPCAGEECGVHAVCGAGGRCECEAGHEGDPAVRCFPRLATLCSCREIVLSTTSAASLAVQPGSFGVYFLAGAAAGHPVYQHESGQLFLYQQDGSWLVSDRVGSRAGGIQNQVGWDHKHNTV